MKQLNCLRLELRLNPFVSQVNYYTVGQVAKQAVSGYGLNPFVSQVNYYWEGRISKGTRAYRVSIPS